MLWQKARKSQRHSHSRAPPVGRDRSSFVCGFVYLLFVNGSWMLDGAVGAERIFQGFDGSFSWGFMGLNFV